MNTEEKQYFSALARKSDKLNLPKGYVYVGTGGDKLKNKFGDTLSGIQEKKPYGGAAGSLDNHEYMCPTGLWEAVTGLNINDVLGRVILPKRFYIDTINPVISAEIQDKLFSLGYQWPEGQRVSGRAVKFLSVQENDKLIVCFQDLDNVSYNVGEEISIQQLFSAKPAPKLKMGEFVEADEVGIKFTSDFMDWVSYATINAEIHKFRKTLGHFPS